MTDVASKAANAVADTVKGAAKAVDPKQGEAAPMHGRTAIVTGRPCRLRATALCPPAAGGWHSNILVLRFTHEYSFCARLHASGAAAPRVNPMCCNAGANVGLGYETSLAIAKAGGHVVMAVRNPQKGEE